MSFRLRSLCRLVIVLVSVLALPALGQTDCDIVITPPDDPAAPRFLLEVLNGCTPCELGPGSCLHQDPWQSDIDGIPFTWEWASDEGPEVWATDDLRCLSDGAHLLTVENVDYTGWTDCWCRSGPQTFPFNITRSDAVVSALHVSEGTASVTVNGTFSPAAVFRISALNLETGTETVVHEGAHHDSFSVSVPGDDGIYVLEQTNVCTSQQSLLVAVPEALDPGCGAPGGTCCTGTCFGGPVKSATGNMRYTDTDPLPGLPVQRTYDSARPSTTTARFGPGWSSIFDARIVLSAYDRVVLVTEDAELYVFRSHEGAYEQEWPAAIGTARATLANDFFYGGWLFRMPDGQTTYRYDTSGLQEIRSLDTGRTIAIEYDAFGRPSAVTDSWGAWSLDVEADPGSGRITAITMADDPALGWQYVYTGDTLTSVLSATGAPWRTYEYGTSLEAVRDSLGNLIESHTFDGTRAISDTSPGSEIVIVTYDHPGRVPGERFTETTSAAGAVTRYYSRPIAGSRRIVEVDGTCDCGVEDVVSRTRTTTRAALSRPRPTESRS